MPSAEEKKVEQEQKKIETSKKIFLKELEKITFKLKNEDLENDQEIKDKIIEPCEKLQKAIEKYNKQTTEKKKSKISKIIKSKLNEKYLKEIKECWKFRL